MTTVVEALCMDLFFRRESLTSPARLSSIAPRGPGNSISGGAHTSRYPEYDLEQTGTGTGSNWVQEGVQLSRSAVRG